MHIQIGTDYPQRKILEESIKAKRTRANVTRLSQDVGDISLWPHSLHLSKAHRPATPFPKPLCPNPQPPLSSDFQDLADHSLMKGPPAARDQLPASNPGPSRRPAPEPAPRMFGVWTAARIEGPASLLGGSFRTSPRPPAGCAFHASDAGWRPATPEVVRGAPDRWERGDPGGINQLHRHNEAATLSHGLAKSRWPATERDLLATGRSSVRVMGHSWNVHRLSLRRARPASRTTELRSAEAKAKRTGEGLDEA